jgi:hypothetical protein
MMMKSETLKGTFSHGVVIPLAPARPCRGKRVVDKVHHIYAERPTSP